MYIHIGQDISIHSDDIIGIFDLDTATVAKRTREFLSTAERNGDIFTITSDLPKSFIVCRAPWRRSKKIIYLSQISSQTLLHRAVNFDNIEF